MPTDSQPTATPVPVEVVASYARRVGDHVRVVLTLHDDLREQVGGRLTHRQVFLRLTHKVDGEKTGLRVPVEVTPGDKPVLVAEVPLAELSPDTWSLALRVGRGGPLVRLEARLLVTDAAVQPIALLVGPRPRTLLDAPAPR